MTIFATSGAFGLSSMMQMALSNAVHPEYGVVTIPFPIPEEEYGHCLELLEALEIGNAVNRDCKVQEVQDGPPILKRLEGSSANAGAACLSALEYHVQLVNSTGIFSRFSFLPRPSGKTAAQTKRQTQDDDKRNIRRYAPRLYGGG